METSNTNWRKEYYRYQKYFLNIGFLSHPRQEVRMFIELLLTIITVSIFLFFALRPTVITIIKLNREIADKKNLISQMDQKISNLSQAQTTYNKELPKLKLLDTTIPQTPTPEGFVRQIEGLAAKNGISLNGISSDEISLASTLSPDKKTPNKTNSLPQNVPSYQISITIAGSYEAVDNFTKDVKNMRRPLWIDTVSFNTNQENPGLIILTIIGRVAFLP